MAAPAVAQSVARSDAWRRLFTGRNVIVAAVIAAVTYIALVPLGFLLWQTFVSGGQFTLDHFREAYSSIGLVEMAYNSIAFAVGSAAFAISLGTLLAYLIVRTDVPFKPVMFAASLVPLIIPGILHTIAWFFLLSPQIGVLNQHLIHPLPALYAAILIMAVRTLESFEVPAVLGLNQHIWVFTSRIWSVLNAVPPDYSTAGAYAMSLLVLTTIGILWHNRLAKRGRSFQTVTGKGFRPRPIPLGAWKWPATALIFAYFVIAVVLPLGILFYASTQRFYSPPSHYTLTHTTWDNYRTVWHDPLVRHGFKN